MNDINCKEITEGYELSVFECDECGFHLGLDGSWLNQTYESVVYLTCPCCNIPLSIETSK